MRSRCRNKKRRLDTVEAPLSKSCYPGATTFPYPSSHPSSKPSLLSLPLTFSFSSLLLGLGARTTLHSHPLHIRIRAGKASVKRIPTILEQFLNSFRCFGRKGPAVVAFASEDGQPFAAHANLNGVVVDFAFTDRGINQHVLVAGFFADAGIELRKGVLLGSVKDVPTGIVGVFRQARELAVEVVAARSHAVHRNPLAQEFGERLIVIVRVEFRAVLAVGDQQDDFPAFQAVAVAEKHRSVVNGVIQRLGGLTFDRAQRLRVRSLPWHRTGSGRVVDGGPAEGIAGRRGRAVAGQFGTTLLRRELVLILGEALPGMEILVEAADECLIAGAQAPDDRNQTRFDLGLIL